MKLLKQDPGLGTSLPNIISFVDILLLIVLANQANMLSADRGAFAINPPVVKMADDVNKPTRVLRINVDATGKFAVFGEEISFEKVRAEIIRSKPKTVVAIAADRKAPLGAVSDVVDAALNASRTYYVEARKG
ncbi:MAG TPA: biopolymer transporter ExbD [Pirellulales bacterium]|nr:biopolymer transporter ExbD [Pirellulales bacterium]